MNARLLRAAAHAVREHGALLQKVGRASDAGELEKARGLASVALRGAPAVAAALHAALGEPVPVPDDADEAVELAASLDAVADLVARQAAAPPALTKAAGADMAKALVGPITEMFRRQRAIEADLLKSVDERTAQLFDAVEELSRRPWPGGAQRTFSEIRAMRRHA